jgi:hypothetical protein
MRFTLKPGIVIHRKIAWLLLFSIFSLAFVSWLIYANKRNIERTTLRIGQTYEITGMVQEMVVSQFEYIAKFKPKLLILLVLLALSASCRKEYSPKKEVIIQSKNNIIPWWYPAYGTPPLTSDSSRSIPPHGFNLVF